MLSQKKNRYNQSKIKSNQSSSKGFISFDALFSMLIVVLLLLLFLNYYSYLSLEIKDKLSLQKKFNRIVSIADYLVKIGMAHRTSNAGYANPFYFESSIRYPNWVDESLIPTRHQIAIWAKNIGLKKLDVYFGTEPNDDYEICIYRVVVVGPQKEISKLYVCGE